MIYVDTSVLARWVLGEPRSLPHPGPDDVLVTSRLADIELPRTLDRLRRHGRLTDADYAERHGIALRMLARVDRVRLYVAILRRAAEPFPVALGTLDAVHLATAMALRDGDVALRVATHDVQLGAAARALGFDVDGG